MRRELASKRLKTASERRYPVPADLGEDGLAAKHLEASTIKEGHLHAVWLTNEGLKTSSVTLAWEELRQLIAGISLVADTLADSNKLAEKRAEYAAGKGKS